MKRLRLIVGSACALGIFLGGASDQALAEFLILSVPGSSRTAAADIDGDLIVGTYNLGGNHGFLFDRRTGTYTTIEPPGSKSGELQGISGSRMAGSAGNDAFVFDNTTATYTILKPPDAEYSGATGIDGQYVIGDFQYQGFFSRGFLYDISTGAFTTLRYPDSGLTLAWAISGQNVVGFYRDSHSVDHGYLFDGINYVTIDFPGMPYTIATAVDGANVGGTYRDSQGHQFGYLYDGSTYTTLIPPWVKGDYLNVGISDISGSSVVGNYYNPGSQSVEAFLYDINNKTYRPIRGPGRPSNTSVNAIFGNTVVGHFEFEGADRGFAYDLTPYPEPSGIVLLLSGLGSIGGFALCRGRFKRQK